MSPKNLTQRELTIENSTQIRALNARMLSQERNQKSMHNDIRRVLSHIESDDKTNTEGVIEKSNRHDKEIRELLTYNKELKIIAGTISGVIATIIGVINWVLNK